MARAKRESASTDCNGRTRLALTGADDGAGAEDFGTFWALGVEVGFCVAIADIRGAGLSLAGGVAADCWSF